MDYASMLYREAKAKLQEPDGEHCIICGRNLPKRKQKYCSQKCWTTWYHGLGIPNFTKIRNSIFKRDKYTCKLCGRKKRVGVYSGLECDHIIPTAIAWKISKREKLSSRELFERFIWNPDNLRTLCKKCHRIVTNGFIKKKAWEDLKERQRKCRELQIKGDGNNKYFDGYKFEDVRFMLTLGTARWFRYVEKPFLIPSLLEYVEPRNER